MAQPPSVAELERCAVPVCFPGMVDHWPAVHLWAGEGGLQRLIELAACPGFQGQLMCGRAVHGPMPGAGDAQVEAMVSPAADGPLVIGDMQHLILLGCSLREFLDGSLQRRLAEAQPPGTASGGGGRLRLYLAQSPLLAAAAGEGGGSRGAWRGGSGGGPCVEGAAGAVPGPSVEGSGGGDGGSYATGLQPTALHPLMADLGFPPPLRAAGQPLHSVNCWASLQPMRSSLHYDPYHNLLCVVRGRKRVRLVPPAATPHLQPQPVTHESANHSPADLGSPDFERFPGLRAALAAAQVFEVAAGDALFIPEGWWHQVDSQEGTLAANFWWEGAVSRQLGGPTDRYYFRRLVQSLLEQQKAAALAALPRCDLLHAAAALSAAEPGVQPQQAQQSQQSQQPQPSKDCRGTSTGEPPSLTAEQAAAVKVLTAAVASHRQPGEGVEPPPVVCAVVATLAANSAQSLLAVLLHLAQQQPELAAHLLLHSLDPAGWELLSGAIEQRQDELAAEGGAAAAEEAVGALCDQLYGCADRHELLDAILQRKEAFSRQALRSVLQTELAGAL